MALSRFRPSMYMVSFPVHGSYQLATEGRLLVVHTRGPWNREHILDYINTLEARLLELAGNPWAVLAFVAEEGMHTPDSFDQMVDAIRRQRSIGRCGTAVLLQEVFAESVVRDILSRMYDAAGEPHRFFDDELAARAWLAERLAQSAGPA